MTDINYPPSRTVTLETALADVDDRISELDDRIDDLAAEAATTDEALADARTHRQDATRHRQALQWAVDEFGGDAEITLEAHTTTTRSRVMDTANQQTMGSLGQSQLADWMHAAGVADAPWLDGGEDLGTRADLLGALPPRLTDWIATQLEDLNDLGN